MTSQRPYLMRAIYEWIVDNGMTPHVLVNARSPGVRVPPHTIKDGQVVLNIADRAVSRLEMGNDAIRFSAHYGETTTMPKALLTLMRAKPHKAFDVLLRYGGKTVGRANIAYGLALAAIEVHCCGYCTAAAAYGVPYNPRDANMYDTIRRTYFSWL